MYNALHPSAILLPRNDVDLTKWAVIACDQFTSQPEYWKKVEALVQGEPSSLHLILPEVYLSQTEDRLISIRECMGSYLSKDILQESVHGAVLLERNTVSGTRLGLVVALDLEAYSFDGNSAALIRPTEQTVPERVPPRTKIRFGAPIEIPHVMMLIDDPKQTVIEPIYNMRNELRSLYDFELMLNGGHLRGWAVESDAFRKIDTALSKLAESCDGMLYAVDRKSVV